MAGIFPECETCFGLVLSSILITKMVVNGSKFHKVMQQRTLFPLEPELCYCETSVFHRRVNKSSRQPDCPPARGTQRRYKANHRRFCSLKRTATPVICSILNIFQMKLFSFVVYHRIPKINGSRYFRI